MNLEISEAEKQLLEQYGIVAETKTVFHYKGHTYEHLEHAIKYAKIDTARASGDGDDSRPERGFKAFWQRLTRQRKGSKD